MDEKHFLASLKCLNAGSLEEFYINSLPMHKRMGFQITLLKILTRNYTALMIIYALVITLYTNLKGLFFPEKAKEIPETLSNKLPSKNWYQGCDGNCSVVAVIKAVQARYKNDIFKKLNQDAAGNYLIVLKDDVELAITPEELDLVKKESRFLGPENKTKNYAYLAYAAIVKNAVKRGEFTSFKGALKYFNSGSFPEYCSELLGYIHYTMITEPMRGLSDIIVAYSKSNAVCINNGFIEGCDEKLIFAGHDMMGQLLDKAIVIV